MADLLGMVCDIGKHGCILWHERWIPPDTQLSHLLPSAQGSPGKIQSAEKGYYMFCNGCNNSSLWLIILIIILFGCGNGCGNNCGCGCGNSCGCGNNCGCGCGNSCGCDNSCGCGC